MVHGGISDKTLVKDLMKIKRDKYVSILKPPLLDENGNLKESLDDDELFEWKQVTFKDSICIQFSYYHLCYYFIYNFFYKHLIIKIYFIINISFLSNL